MKLVQLSNGADFKREPRGYRSSVKATLFPSSTLELRSRPPGRLPAKCAPPKLKQCFYKPPSSCRVSDGEATRGKRQGQLHRTLSVVSIRLHKQTGTLWAVSRPLPGPNEDRLCPFYQFGGIMAVYSCLVRSPEPEDSLGQAGGREAGVKGGMLEVTQLLWSRL